MSGLYEKVLQAAQGLAVVAPRPPRASAAVIPYRMRGGRAEVLWMRRARGQRFMGGWYAFPGGGLASADAGLEVVGEVRIPPGTDPRGALPPAMTDGIELANLMIPGLVATALRELVEEMGWWVGEKLVEVADDDLDGLRSQEATIVDLVDKYGPFDASKLTYAGRWLTPPLGPMRFDNRFFLLDADRLEPQRWQHEVETAEWIRPIEGIERWQNGAVMAAPPVLYILRALAEIGAEIGAEVGIGSGVGSGAGSGETAEGDPTANDSTLQRLVTPSEANIGAFRRIEFQPGVLLFPLVTPTLPPAATTNCFVLGNGERVVVDPGSPFPEQQQRFLAALSALPGGLAAVKEIWLTHHHPDHVGGVAALAGALRVPIAAHAKTAQRLEGQIAVERTLADGQQMTLIGDPDLGPDLQVTAMHTPGHASGHLCFSCDHDRWLIAGDMISGVSTIVIDSPDGNMGDYFRSLARLAEMSHFLALPAHGPALLDGRQHFTRALKHRQWRESRIQEAWDNGERKMSRLVKAAYEEELPVFVQPLAKRQVWAHLQHMGFEEKVEADQKANDKASEGGSS